MPSPPSPAPGRPPAPGAPGWAWAAFCLGLAAAGVIAHATTPSGLLAWRASLWPSHPWMLWSASLGHMDGWHLLGNLLALAALAALGTHLRCTLREVLAVLLAWPAGNAALALWPQISAYMGLSGLLFAMLAVLAVRAALAPGMRLEAVLLACGLALKLASERAWWYPVAFDAAWGFNVVQAAHLAGALAGLAAALLLRLPIRGMLRP